MVLNENQKQGLKQLEKALLYCEQEKIESSFVIDFIIDFFVLKGFKIFYKNEK